MTADLRNFFHQLEIHHEVSAIFSVNCDDTIFQWRVLPMGHSYSPRNAQSMSWAALLHFATEDNGLKEAAEQLHSSKHPPSFVVLKTAAKKEVGVVIIWYDNFLIFCKDQEMTSALCLTVPWSAPEVLGPAVWDGLPAAPPGTRIRTKLGCL